MPDDLTAAERDWAAERVERLRRMLPALDEDLPSLAGSGAWASFWEDMRRLYSRTLIQLSTALATGDRRCLRSGTALWLEVEELIQGAGRELSSSLS